jgi:hypothetical protein
MQVWEKMLSLMIFLYPDSRFYGINQNVCSPQSGFRILFINLTSILSLKKGEEDHSESENHSALSIDRRSFLADSFIPAQNPFFVKIQSIKGPQPA